ncbi:MAG: RAD55 family ATPase, partial [Candidatus Hodarchaeota archaeon]
MSKTRGNLPPELPDLSKLDKGYSLLIKGLPGTGKSSLALQLTASVPNSFFISTRINPEVIMKDFSWLKQEINTNRKSPFFFDATRSDIPITSKYIKPMNFETIPEFVQLLFSLGRDISKKIIAIDSWNALTSNLTESQVSHWESAIIQHFKSEDSKIIFVVEGTTPVSLDWIVDGITVLSKRTITSPYGIARRIREINFVKMRGREIQNETYLATLAKGQLRAFYPFKYRFPAIMLKSNTIGDPDERHISTGSSDFDELIGNGFLKGSWNLFEVATPVGDALDIFLFPLITNHLNQKRSMISVFREGVTFESKRHY